MCYNKIIMFFFNGKIVVRMIEIIFIICCLFNMRFIGLFVEYWFIICCKRMEFIVYEKYF